ncbi:TPA: hypothetical protein ACH3X3_007145 [Trebouxia sp. C0006]
MLSTGIMKINILYLVFAFAVLTSAGAVQGASNGSSSRKLLDDACLGWATSYGQCGGTQCPSGSNQCSDSAYLCCPEDFSCQRFNEYYWSCFPEDSDISVPTAAPAPAPSGAPAFAPGYAPSAARGSAPSGYARASPSPPAYGLSPASPTPTAYGSPSATPTAYGSPSATPTASPPRQTPAAPQSTPPAEYAPPAEEDSPPSQWLSSDCEVVNNNADYPDGLQCSGELPDPSCCSGDTCYTYSFWDSSKPHLAFAASEPHAGLGSCTGDFLIACCPAVVPE